MARFCLLCVVIASTILLWKAGQLHGAPLLLGNQMTALSVIPRSEEQAQALLQFFHENPHYGTPVLTHQITVNAEEVILIRSENLSRVSNDLEKIGLQLGASSEYQIVP